MQITASLVNELRQKTGVGMMQCKKALTETDGDMEKALELLRKQGAAVAAKRADKAAKEGRVYLIETAEKAAAFELTCETEPVSNNDDFVALAAMATKAVETQDIASVEDLKNAVVDGVKINDRLQDVLGLCAIKRQHNIIDLLPVSGLKTQSQITVINCHIGVTAVIIDRNNIGAAGSDNFTDDLQLTRLVCQCNHQCSVSAAHHKASRDDTGENIYVNISAGYQTYRFLSFNRKLSEQGRRNRYSSCTFRDQLLVFN